jgi:hypothetical protein
MLNVSINTSSLFRAVVMADFDDSNSLSEIATTDGIYSLSSPNIPLLDYSLYVNEYDVDLIVAPADLSNNNFVIATQSDKIVVAGFSAVDVVVCGDTVCDSSENNYFCPADCSGEVVPGSEDSLVVGDVCVNASQCDTGKCLYNFCVYKDNNEVCSSNAQCLSGVCRSGRCVKSSLWQNIDASKNVNFGDDEKTNNFLSIGTLVLIGGTLIASGTSIGIICGGFFVAIFGVFFVYVGWLSFWIYALGMLGAIVGIVFVVILKKGD